MTEATAQTKARKKKVVHTAIQKMQIYLAYKRLSAENAVSDTKRCDTDLWLAAQSEAIPDKSQHVHFSSFTSRKIEYRELLAAGKLDVVPAARDHRPLAERGFVPVKPTPIHMMPPKFVDSTTESPVPPSTSTPMSLPLGGGILDQAIASIVRHVVATELLPPIHKMISEMMLRVDAKLDDQYIRLLEYWDPELAKQVKAGSTEMPSLPSAGGPLLSVSGDGKTVTVIDAPLPPPTPPKKRVLICGGKEDGFWTFLQDSLPENVIVEFCDGHKPRSVPTGKKFDLVVVHWMTGHTSRAVIKNYYPQHEYFSKGSSTKLVLLIKEKLGLK